MELISLWISAKSATQCIFMYVYANSKQNDKTCLKLYYISAHIGIPTYIRNGK